MRIATRRLRKCPVARHKMLFLIPWSMVLSTAKKHLEDQFGVLTNWKPRQDQFAIRPLCAHSHRDDAVEGLHTRISVGLRAGPCSFHFWKWDCSRSFTDVHGRSLSRGARCPVRCARRIGVDRGRVGCLWRRCAVGIGDGRVVSEAPCCAAGIGGRRLVSDAVRRWDLRGACLCPVCLATLCRGDYW